MNDEINVTIQEVDLITSTTNPFYSGISGYSGTSGYSGYSGYVGQEGVSGYSGISGYSGTSGFSGTSGYSGFSGYSGVSTPIGVITPFIGGYFTNSINGGFTDVLGSTVANVNSLLNSTGWYVCDGSVLNIIESPIFNGPNRYLPNLTDNRFIMGSTSIGIVGGSNSADHSHVMDGHTHGMGHNHPIPHTHSVAGHSHTMQGHDHIVPDHRHSVPSHGHADTFAVVSNTLTVENLAAHTHFSLLTSGTGSEYTGFSDVSYPVNRLYGYQTGSTGLGAPHGHSLNGAVLNAAAFNTAQITAFRTTGGPVNSSGMTLNDTSTTFIVTQEPNTTYSSDTIKTSTDYTTSTSQVATIENRPSFISCIYIMRVF